MITPRDQLNVLRAMAGEGNYHNYKLLDSGKRVHIFLKHLRTTAQYCLGRGVATNEKAIAFIKGDNQARLHSEMNTTLNDLLGSLDCFSSSALTKKALPKLPRMTLSAFISQVWLLIILLATGQKRYLNLYYLAFYNAIQVVVKKHLANLETFVCYNDQPFDVAALVVALNRRPDCKTITIQHGLILGIPFYFPTNSKEFWAWGDMCREHFKSRHLAGEYIVMGRYEQDQIKLKDQFCEPPVRRKLKVLIGPSFHHDEIKRLLSIACDAVPIDRVSQEELFVKLHPATKKKAELRRWMQKNTPQVTETHADMTAQVDRMDCLLTLYSTSAVDFLLRGKPVFFTSVQANTVFPSLEYGFSEDDLQNFLYQRLAIPEAKNESRKQFLKNALNV